jgi:hypothetical protein
MNEGNEKVCRLSVENNVMDAVIAGIKADIPACMVRFARGKTWMRDFAPTGQAGTP